MMIPRRFLLGIIGCISACGVPAKPALSVFLPGQQVTEKELRIAKGEPTSPEDTKTRHRFVSQAEMLRVQRWSLVGDTDKDRIPNAQDPDMDGDGLPNFADPLPLSRDDVVLDSDSDGIADWIDEAQRPDNPNRLELDEGQSRLYRNHKVIVMRSWAKSTQSDLKYLKAIRDLETILSDRRMALLNPAEKTQVVVVDNSRSLVLCGRYDPDWQTLEFFMDTLSCPSAQTTLTHELFHAGQASRPAVFLDFLKAAGWAFDPLNQNHLRLLERQVSTDILLKKSFDDGASIEVVSTESILMAWKGPTPELFEQNPRLKTWFVNSYSATNPMEHFAESGTVSFFSNEALTPEFLAHYPNTNSYLGSELHDFFNKLWDTVEHHD